MLEFFSGLGAVIILGIVAMVIDASRDHTLIDNTQEYYRMFEQGLVERKRRRTY